MKRYLLAYGLWLTAVLAMAAIALSWYRHVEEIGWRELAARVKPTGEYDPQDDSL